MRVFVYWNLNQGCWSIKALDGEDRGRVIGHASSFEITGARFRVSEAGRQRVLREKRKNVHAGVVGELTGVMYVANHGRMDDPVRARKIKGGSDITYNPYEGPHFVTKAGRHPVAFAPKVQGFYDRTVLAQSPRWA